MYSGKVLGDLFDVISNGIAFLVEHNDRSNGGGKVDQVFKLVWLQKMEDN